MAGKRAKRMKLVLQLAERSEQEAADALQQYREKLQQAQAQLQQVADYQAEYIAQLNEKKSPKNASEMLNDRQFLQQLSEAEQAQQERFIQLERQQPHFLSNWQTFYQRRKNIEKLIVRLNKSDDELADKQLQKEMDELAMLAQQRSNNQA
jgi:flagellar export protein FliJ